MPDIVKIKYHQTGESVQNTANGMLPTAARAYAERNSQCSLIKAPPASGKSRALMFIALDKIRKQGLKKVIVAVPERSIAGSFVKADLKKDNDFFANWEPDDECNLCTQKDEKPSLHIHISRMLSELKPHAPMLRPKPAKVLAYPNTRT